MVLNLDKGKKDYIFILNSAHILHVTKGHVSFCSRNTELFFCADVELDALQQNVYFIQPKM